MKRRHLGMLALLTAMTGLAIHAETPPEPKAPSRITAICAGHLFDGTGSTWVADAMIKDKLSRRR
jgi:hypothetical protein